MDWAMATLLWIGNLILIYKKHWTSFIFFLVANIGWTIYWYFNHQTAAMVLTTTFVVQNVLGIIAWRKGQK